MPLLDTAKLCQRAERLFAGTQCGLLDQLSVLSGAVNSLLAINFQDHNTKQIPLPADIVFLIINTHVKHVLTDSAYNERRAECEAAVHFFAETLRRPVTWLCEVTPTEYAQYAKRMPALLARRARHVILENQRVQAAIAALQDGDQTSFGHLMFQSHDSSRVSFENSCPELDLLVDLAKTMPQVIGARLSGGGFGGSIVAMTHAEDAGTLATALAQPYEKHFHRTCTVRALKASDGARSL